MLTLNGLKEVLTIIPRSRIETNFQGMINVLIERKRVIVVETAKKVQNAMSVVVGDI